ncbi:hypothetical protein QLG13_01715 [Rhodococcus aetherivorans]|uniref:hypothetical protein n=1 Tax=Rhodococcus aetherivorans TaxID=191292 RepID=UPI00045C922E|nr:hypothetical protein [Rhodococcus aetherivorans]KDE10501.1 hypothetical protein N505_0126505 [Rhodococcus aetherivorans]
MIAAGAAFALRGTARLRDASLFAEDGQIFLAEAHNLGSAAFVEPYAGYLHSIPRILAWLLAPVPVTGAPALYAAAAMLVHLLMLTPALSARLDWLVPGRLLRAVLFASLCLMPPLWEVLANVANLIFVGGICMLLLVLSNDPRTRTGRTAELVAVALLGLSGPLIVIFLPWFVWRWWRVGRTPHSTLVAMVSAVAAGVQGLTYLRSDRDTPGGGTAFLLVQTVYERVGGSWLFGDAEIVAPNGSAWVIGATVGWCLGALVLSVAVLPRVAPVLWALLAVLLGSAVHAYGDAMIASSFHFQRHIVIPVAIVVVLLVAVVGQAPTRWIAGAASLWLVIGAAAMIHDFVPEPYPYRPDLNVLQECVDSGAATCRQPIFDGTWTVELRQ